MPKYKTVFSLRLRAALREEGIEPILEMDNFSKKGFKCWIYEYTEQFAQAFERLMGGSSNATSR
jgi:hypothetical protein